MEDYWWPRIVEHELEVDVFDTKENRLVPQPMQRPHLKPFIDAWNVVIQRSPPTAGQERHQFNRHNDKQIGAVGLVTLEVDEEGRTTRPCTFTIMSRSASEDCTRIHSLTDYAFSSFDILHIK